MSVEDILAEMARNAGRVQLQRGQILGDVINSAAQIPRQYYADQDQQRQEALKRLQVQQQMQFEQARAAREEADSQRKAGADARDQAKSQAGEEYDKVVNAGLSAAMGGDVTKFDAQAAYDAVSKMGKPEAIRDVINRHRDIVSKPVEFDPKKGLQNPDTGEILRQPEVPQMTPAEKAQRDETERHNRETERISSLTEGRTEAAQKETARHNRATESTAARAADPFGGQGNAAGIDVEKLPINIRDQAQALVEGRRQLDPRLASKPIGQTIINAAYALDPTFDQGNYNARYKARTDLTNPGGTGGKTIGALNTAIQHAGKLSDLIETLDNYESPIANAVVNPIRTATGSTKVTNYDTVAPQLAKEIERVWRGAGGTAGEIHDLIETIGHNKGKQQQREALQNFVELAKGKLDSTEQQRDNVMGKTAGASIPVLFEQSKPIMDKIAQRASSASGGVKVLSITPVK